MTARISFSRIMRLLQTIEIAYFKDRESDAALQGQTLSSAQVCRQINTILRIFIQYLKMALIKRVTIENFECFRDRTSFEFSDATFFIGENNSGKSSVFRAINVFFNGEFEQKYFNDTKFKGRKDQGWNTCSIKIQFDLSFVRTKALKERLMSNFNKKELIEIERQFKQKGSRVEDEYIINEKRYGQVMLNGSQNPITKDVKTLLESVKVNYIHPQQGKELLKNAQESLRTRLLDNWGRRGAVTRDLASLEKVWATYRIDADKYLSELLTEEIKKFWGQGKVKIELPKSIKDIIDISGITFQSEPKLSEIPLTSHGTGVQQSLLYYASYVLASDKSLARNKQSNNVWLLEEPESFLHADAIIKLSKDLTSKEWLENIQMCITTHSGLLLSSSVNPNVDILWNILNKHRLISSIKPKEIEEKKLEDIGNFMGDRNFDVYFYSNLSKVFIEDSGKTINEKYAEEGIDTKGLAGTPEVLRYLRGLDVVTAGGLGRLMNTKFIIDGDEGKQEVKDYIKEGYKKSMENGFIKYSHPNGSLLVTLPEGETSENLFDEYSQFLIDSAHLICSDDLKLKSTIVNYLVHSYNRLQHRHGSNPCNNLEEVMIEISKDNFAKAEFWRRVKDNNYKISKTKIATIKKLLEIH
jgi:AAA15 family ATPase/GTPase